MYTYTLEQFAQGRFDVFAENGTRAGSIIGGANNWTAEIGNKVVGRFKNKVKAAHAILKDRGIQGIYQQMRAIIESPNGLLQSYKDDFYVCDRQYIAAWHCATSLIWVVRKSGTHLFSLDLPLTKTEGEAILDAMHPNRTGSPWELYLVDVLDLKVKPITETVARKLIAQTPKYAIKDGAITSTGAEIAKFNISLSLGSDRQCDVTIDCLHEPSQRMIAVLQRMARIALHQAKNNYSIFASSTISVLFEKKKMFCR